MKTTSQKLKPSELGCGRPYTLSAKGKLLVAPAGAAPLQNFIDTYQRSARSLMELIYRWWTMAGDHQIFAVLFVCPTHVSPAIEESALWRDTEAMAKTLSGQGWREFASSRGYYILRALAGIEGRAARGPEILQRMVKELPLPGNLLTVKRFAEIFEPFPSEVWRGKLTAHVVGMLRAFFSQSENVRSENAAKAADLARLRALHPVFFTRFEQLLKAQAAWETACRVLASVRRQLREEGIAVEVTNACQIQAIVERPDLIELQHIPAEHSPETLASFAEHALAHRLIVERMRLGLPDASALATSENSAIRRLSSGNGIREVARDPFFAKQLLRLYNDTIMVIPDGHVDLPNKTERFGRHMVHLGWRSVMNATPASPLAGMKTFFVKELSVFIAALRPIRTPVLRADAAVRAPSLDQGDGWRLVERHPEGVGNAIKIEMVLPAVSNEPAQAVAAVLRGNLAFAKGATLETPLNISDGIFQYRPDQVLPVSHDPSRKTYLKAQGLQLGREGDEFFGSIFVRRMTEAVQLTPGRLKEGRPFAAGERLAILHLCPGGMRLGTLTIFEYLKTGWRIIRGRNVVSRSDAAAFGKLGDRMIRVHNRDVKTFDHLHFELNSLGIAIDAQMAQRDGSPAENGSLASPQGALRPSDPGKVALGQTTLTRIAHHIGSILEENRCVHLLVAGSGRISSHGGAPVPVRQFFALHPMGPRKIAAGHLSIAAQKAGVGISTIAGRYSLIDSKGYSDESTLPFTVGLPYRFLRRGDAQFVEGVRQRTRRGAPEHLYIPTDPERIVDFSRNAAQSILLAWTKEDFRGRGLAALLKMNLRSIALPAEL